MISHFHLYKSVTIRLFSFLLLCFSFLNANANEPYGAPISLKQAKIVMAAAEAEANKNDWKVIISIVDSGGRLVMLQRLDSAQYGSIHIARQKAESSVAFRRPTKVWQDLIGEGGKNLRILNLTNGDAGVLEGGIPIVVDGKIVGGIGVSGVASSNDAKIAQAGIDALVKK